jgi:hypothetical protein
MIRYCFFFLLTLSLTFPIETKAQDQKGITISGIVVNADSLQAVPYTTITINNLLRGTFSDNSGHFSFIASPGDTLQFSSVGYKTDTYILPTTLIGDHYSIIEVLVTDTILLEEIVIYSFPSAEEFSRRFIEINLPDQPVDRMDKNKKEMKKILEEDLIFNKYPVYDVNDGYTRIYNSGIIPPNNLLNPIAWSNYIDDIRKSRQLSRRK